MHRLLGDLGTSSGFEYDARHSVYLETEQKEGINIRGFGCLFRCQSYAAPLLNVLVGFHKDFYR
jgi:hypothetical protein